MPEGNRIAVITNAGGPAILTVDSLEKNGLALAELSEKTKSKLREIVHPEGSLNNPVDLLPIGSAEDYKKVNEIVSADKNVDAVISVFVEPIMVKALPVIEGINAIKSPKPIFQVVMPLPEFWEEYRNKSKTKKPLYRNPENPAVVIAGMLKFKNKPLNTGRIIPGTPPKLNLKSLKGQLLDPDNVQKLADYYKIPTVNTKVIGVDEITKIDVEYPLVLKAAGEEIVHKSDLKGVVLNIKTKDELLRVAEEMKGNFKKKNLKLDSFLIQPLIKPKFELLVGAFKDPSFGPMVMFGSGGKYVEFIKDTSIRSAYLTEMNIDRMINSTKMGKIIQGVRGDEPVDLDKIKNTIRAIGQMMIDNSDITECDLNPLLVGENNELYAVDVRIKCY